MPLCNKRKYDNETAAVKAAKAQVERYGIHLRAYYHYDCKAWHLTSQSPKQYLKRFKK